MSEVSSWNRPCVICGTRFNVRDGFWHYYCPICGTIMDAVGSMSNDNHARERLHLIMKHIAKGVDD